MKRENRMGLWYLVIVGFAFILWADAVCDFFKLDITGGTFRIFIITSIVLTYAYVKNETRVKNIMKEQLGK